MAVKMGGEARLARLVIIRHDDQRRVGADIGRRPDQLDRRRGRIASAARNYRDAPFGNFDRRGDDLPVLFARKRRALAGRPARNQRVAALGNLPLDQPAK